LKLLPDELCLSGLLLIALYLVLHFTFNHLLAGLQRLLLLMVSQSGVLDYVLFRWRAVLDYAWVLIRTHVAAVEEGPHHFGRHLLNGREPGLGLGKHAVAVDPLVARLGVAEPAACGAPNVMALHELVDLVAHLHRDSFAVLLD
jgi:hypothetical protein